MKKLSIGNDNFEDLINSNGYYVDKTKTIKELFDKNSKVVLYPRPRRFGKSLFISMLENFFEITKKEQNKNLFDGLYIKNSPYFSEYGKYPVIELDFKELKTDSFSSAYIKFKRIISTLFYSRNYVNDVLNENEKKYFLFY